MSLRERICRLLHAIHSYYDQFTGLIETQHAALKKPVEDKFREMVQLSKWDLSNYWSLKESSEKTHRKLIKLAKSYEEVLRAPVRDVIVKDEQSDAAEAAGDTVQFGPLTTPEYQLVLQAATARADELDRAQAAAESKAIDGKAKKQKNETNKSKREKAEDAKAAAELKAKKAKRVLELIPTPDPLPSAAHFLARIPTATAAPSAAPAVTAPPGKVVPKASAAVAAPSDSSPADVCAKMQRIAQKQGVLSAGYVKARDDGFASVEQISRESRRFERFVLHLSDFCVFCLCSGSDPSRGQIGSA